MYWKCMGNWWVPEQSYLGKVFRAFHKVTHRNKISELLVSRPWRLAKLAME